MAGRIILPPVSIIPSPLLPLSRLTNLLVSSTCCVHLSPYVLTHPTHHFFPFRAFAQSSSLFHPTPSHTHQVSFCDSYGVDPTHCNFMLSGLETSLDLLARSFSFVATIRLICPSIGLRPLSPDPPSSFSILTLSSFHLSLAIPLLSSGIRIGFSLIFSFTLWLHWNWASW